MNIEIARERPSRLLRQVWRFWVVLDHGHTTIKVVLDRYALETRATTRHRYRSNSADRYSRLGRGSLDYDGAHMKLDAVELPADVAAEARAKVADIIVILKEYV